LVAALDDEANESAKTASASATKQKAPFMPSSCDFIGAEYNHGIIAQQIGKRSIKQRIAIVGTN